MPDNLIADIRHFLDGEGQVPDLPGPAQRLLDYMGAIVAQATGSQASPAGVSVRCRRRPGRRPCPGVIDCAIDRRREAIAWACPVCGDRGVITGWEGTRWDGSHGCERPH